MRWAGLGRRSLQGTLGPAGNDPPCWDPAWVQGAGALLDLIPCYAAVISRKRIILWANNALLREAGHAVGKPCYELYRGLPEVCPECELDSVLASGMPGTWQEPFTGRHCGNIQTLVQATSLGQGEDGQEMALKLSTDITFLKRRERQLELSQREYRALFQGVPCYISLQDRDFNILRTNRLFERDLGRAHGRKCYQVYKGRDRKCEPCPVERTFQDGQIHFSEETVRRSSGEPMDVVVYTAPIQDHLGNIFAVMEMATDITEVKRLQRELATLGQAVAITAHSIKNILSGLEGGAYVVQSALRRQDPALAQKGWQMVREAVDMAGRLVQDILLISKGRTPEYKRMRPEETAIQVHRLFEKRARDLGVELLLRLPDPPLEPLPLDPKGIHTALANLVANALDACASMKGAASSPRVELRVMELPERGAVCFQVEDNGPGVLPHVEEKLFREMVSTKGCSGTGLGLVVTKKILREHGGTARFMPRKDGGAVFELLIPKRSPWQDATEEKPLTKTLIAQEDPAWNSPEACS